jgi:hypothetical protein
MNQGDRMTRHLRPLVLMTAAALTLAAGAPALAAATKRPVIEKLG